ncbi:MAG: hypothetical protein ABI165_06620 [Bryobacteraceae bacterium]
MRLTASGRIGVDSSRNLEASQSGVRFFSQKGYYAIRVLQADWNARRGAGIKFEILERPGGDLPSIGVRDILKEKKRRRVHQLGAQPLSLIPASIW